MTIDPAIKTELEAAAFRHLIQHLQQHTDVQNIELMLTADFCRNCLAKWYSTAAREHGIDLDYAAAQEVVYGMPYSDWKQHFQTTATPEQLQAFEARQNRAARSD